MIELIKKGTCFLVLLLSVTTNLQAQATDDAITAKFGKVEGVAVFDNDGGFTEGGTTTLVIVATGTTTSSQPVIDLAQGIITYAPTYAEALAGTPKEIIYKVCTDQTATTCATATITVTITDAIDSDGDGVTDAKETSDLFDDIAPALPIGTTNTELSPGATDACAYKVTSINTTVTYAGDCDGDGVKDSQEATDGTDRELACSFKTESITLEITSTQDCDGDGVTSKQEGIDGTDPSDGCNYLPASQSVATEPAWKVMDCDGDGTLNGVDGTNGATALNPCLGGTPDETHAFWKNYDCDGDGVTNQQEKDDLTDPDIECDFKVTSITKPQSATWNNGDCDNDGINNGIEVGVNSLEPVNTDNDALPDFKDVDSDGDGISDEIEKAIHSDDDGVFNFRDLDSDNDEISDADEKDLDGDGKLDDTDKDGLPNYIDVDDDNDGFPTIKEGSTNDCNDNGVLDYLDKRRCDITVPEGFSPNGDGVNDLFVIEGVTLYNDATLTVINRWGHRVYKSEGGYDNTWDGKSEIGVNIGDKALPVGTYFYILDLGDGSDVEKGYVYLNK